MAWRLSQTDVPGNDRGEHLAWEVLSHLLRYLCGEIRAPIEHGKCHAENLQSGIHALFYHPQGAHQVTETLQREILALHRHQNSIGSAKAVQGQQLQGRGTVHENYVILLLCPEQRLFQLPLPVLRADQLHRRTCQVGGRRQHISILRFYHRILQGHLVDGNVIGGIFDFPFVQAHAGGGVGLWVEVAQQHLQPQLMEGSRQVHGGGSFSHAALLVDHRYDLTHFSLLVFRVSRETQRF